MANTSIVWKNQTKLRTGYTTGSCAAAAAKAATHMLVSGEVVGEVSLVTPAGIRLYLEVEDIVKENNYVSCAIRKDSGDDPDVTNGILVYARVTFAQDDVVKSKVILEAGEGIGRVTQKGLEQSIGDPAINLVPRRMIREAVEEELQKAGIDCGVRVMIWVPDGAEIARKTFNPKLGIEGGISILGTTGIVEPMSEKALTDTIFVEMKVRRENGMDYCYVVPGNYGSDFLHDTLGYQEDAAVKCSNYVGEVIDDAVRLQMKGILLVGHIGKFIKLAAGIMNTHSRQADGRMEILAAHAAMAGGSRELICQLMECITTTAALELLEKEGILKEVMSTVMIKIEEHLKHRAGDVLEIGAVMFSKEMGILGKTSDADRLAQKIQSRKKNV
ncbi:cobalt-precorrin-5B (C(1))-methyltransferase CbiD [Dorea sp. AF36-15AT]|uniref:cobalt-precorrin-5B (C(1))-methyltransferase CbiD n=1 Tax=Dorea sp. AF36-15AT TaxID=2292041 RepID=UPI000E532A20|nr:cobalt-precorrin-5B (C(1))-methyltransferase CbiD [Dorea sp. AF36-15AT]RHP07833.1 cobalamin biosynthesis protein CbiD [Dorea sp. AF36-15AT]